MNHVVLMGNLTADPEVRFTPKGQAVCEFSIAHNKQWKTEAGEERERVSFISCLIWGKRGEAFAKYHRKGFKALVQGELTQESWEDKATGKKQSKTRVQVDSWEFVGARQEQAAHVPAAPKPAQPQPSLPGGEPEEDECPF